jgi:hypothetical protein
MSINTLHKEDDDDDIIIEKLQNMFKIEAIMQTVSKAM